MSKKINRLVVSAALLAAPIYAEEASQAKAAAMAEVTAEAAPEVAAPQPTEQELTQMLGFMTALGGGVSTLKLEAAGVEEMAHGVSKMLAGKLSIETLPQVAVETAFGEAQARAEALEAGSEESPGFTKGSLEKIGAILALQSGITQLGFGANDAEDIAAGFIEGAMASALSPAFEAKMPAFKQFIEGRVQIAQAAMIAAQERAREAEMAEFKPVADEWSVKDPVNVVLETTQGEVEIELFTKEAPLAVANFVGHIEGGYYDGLSFHRVIDDFMIQGGDPLGTGAGGESIWGKPFPDEFSDDVRFDVPGLLAMANSGPMTNGSQFFITTSTPTWLNDKHTIFGRVVAGYDNVLKIEGVETGAQDKPVEEQLIVKAYVKK